MIKESQWFWNNSIGVGMDFCNISNDKSVASKDMRSLKILQNDDISLKIEKRNVHSLKKTFDERQN